jgi:hypothetical protein
VDQQVAMVVGPEQGLEDAVDLGIDGTVHTRSVWLGWGVGKVLAEPGAGSHSSQMDWLGQSHPRSAFSAFTPPCPG